MSDTLLQQFLIIECIDYVYNLINKALDDWKNGTPPIIKHFEFNRFEITIDGEKQKVIIADVLDVNNEGVQEIEINDFYDEIKRFKQK
ncbi:MAG: hypothetical protein JXB49_30825 [Bacteroidales bacterium]|nr:hypothetical protein [Bacteroidales bacterium]